MLESNSFCSHLTFIIFSSHPLHVDLFDFAYSMVKSFSPLFAAAAVRFFPLPLLLPTSFPPPPLPPPSEGKVIIRTGETFTLNSKMNFPRSSVIVSISYHLCISSGNFPIQEKHVLQIPCE